MIDFYMSHIKMQNWKSKCITSLNKCCFCSFLSFLGVFLLLFSLRRSILISIFTSFSLFLLLRFSRVYQIEITEKIITRQNKNKKKRSQMRGLLSLKRFTKTNWVESMQIAMKRFDVFEALSHQIVYKCCHNNKVAKIRTKSPRTHNKALHKPRRPKISPP